MGGGTTGGAPPLPAWLQGVDGDQVKPLITSDEPTLRVPAGPGTGKTYGLRKRVLRLLHPEGEGWLQIESWSAHSTVSSPTTSEGRLRLS